MCGYFIECNKWVYLFLTYQSRYAGSFVSYCFYLRGKDSSADTDDGGGVLSMSRHQLLQQKYHSSIDLLSY